MLLNELGHWGDFFIAEDGKTRTDQILANFFESIALKHDAGKRVFQYHAPASQLAVLAPHILYLRNRQFAVLGKDKKASTIQSLLVSLYFQFFFSAFHCLPRHTGYIDANAW